MINEASLIRACIRALVALMPMLLIASTGCDEDPSGPETRPKARVVISEPYHGAFYHVGKPLLFSGHVKNKTKSEPDEHFKWFSSIQGELGTGKQFTSADLVEGDHTITLRVRDASGFTIEASIEIHMLMPGSDCSEFRLSVDSEPITVWADSDVGGWITVEAVRLVEFRGDINLSLIGGDRLITWNAFYPPTLAGEKLDSKLHFRATGAFAVPHQRYQLTVLATSANTQCSAQFAVVLVGANGPRAGLIAFESERDGNRDIYVMNPDGSGVRRLTSNPEVDVDASWSPDGTQIVFASERDGDDEIYVMNADGSNKTQLTHNTVHDWNPAWSPDGRIAFRSERDGNSEIYVMNADGSGVTRLTNNPATDAEPAWSHDGSFIAFVSDRDGNDEIYVMNADGSAQRNVTLNAASDVGPAWSPVDDAIAFASDRDGNEEIYILSADGRQMNVTQHPAEDGDPTWSPDGTHIAFTSFRDGNHEIYVMPAYGGGQLNVTRNSAYDDKAAWSR